MSAGGKAQGATAPAAKTPPSAAARDRDDDDQGPSHQSGLRAGGAGIGRAPRRTAP